MKKRTMYYWHCKKCDKVFPKRTQSHECMGSHSALERFEFSIGGSK